MKKIILTICISALTLTFSINAQAKIYKWTDAKGVVHYSATPPVTKKQVKDKPKNIENEIRFAAGKHRPSRTGDIKNKQANNQEKDSESTSELSPPKKELVDYCTSQKSNLKNLKNNFRNVWVDPSGKRTNLSQKQRQEKVDFLKSRIDKDCQEVKTN